MLADAEFGTAAASSSRRWNGPRFRSLILSLVIHAAAIFALLSVSVDTRVFVMPQVDDQAIEPKQERIIWYHLKEIPKISPDNSADSKPITAEKLSPDVIIHDAADAAKDNRLVWRDRKPVEPARQTPAPDMIAVAKGADVPSPAQHPDNAPPPPEPAKPTPKAFVAPAAAPSAAKAAIRVEEPPPLMEQPKLTVADSSISELTSGSKVKYLRRFVPPPAEAQAKKGDGAGPTFVTDAPTLPGAGGTSDVNALIINTVHGPAIDAAPPRASGVSGGPVKGPSSQGGGKGDIQIPGVTVIPRGGEAEASLKLPKDPLKGQPPGPNGSPATPLPFIAPRIAPLENTLSAPLRPTSRSIPNMIEKRFSGRVVYTILLPMKGLPGYKGDWTLWFAERQQVEGMAGAPMRAPLPFRKPARVDMSGGVITNGLVQISAKMDKNGKLSSVAVIGGAEGTADAAIDELQSWEFLPALRNHEPVEVDLIVEIPFGINQPALPLTRVPVLSGVDTTPRATHN